MTLALWNGDQHYHAGKCTAQYLKHHTLRKCMSLAMTVQYLCTYTRVHAGVNQLLCACSGVSISQQDQGGCGSLLWVFVNHVHSF